MNIDDKGNGRLFVVWDDDCSPRLLASSSLYVRCIVRSYFSCCHYSKLISEENFEYWFTSKKKENCSIVLRSGIPFIDHFLNDTLCNAYQQHVKISMILFLDLNTNQKTNISASSLNDNPINRCLGYNFYQAHR